MVIEGSNYNKKIKTLKEVKKENWVVYYIDESNGEKWIREYPNSEYHGGGAPRLRLIDIFPWEK